MSFKSFYFKESILDPIRDFLIPSIWQNDKLKIEIKKFILDKLSSWLKSQNYDMDIVKSVSVLGSITGYQYNEYSDIDVNVVIKLPMEEFDRMTKILPNGHFPPSTKNPVNYYLSKEYKKEWEKEDNGIWDVINDKWIVKAKEPKNKSIPIKNYQLVNEISRFFTSGLDVTMAEYKNDVSSYENISKALPTIKDKDEILEIKKALDFKLGEIINDINSIYIAKHLLKSLRNEAFAGQSLDLGLNIEIKNSNSSINNLIYKYIESLSYFDKIDKILNEKDKWIKIRDTF